MTWLMIYVSVAVAVLAVVAACCARGVRPGLPAVLAAAVLWPVLAVGLIQFGAVRLAASHLQRHTPVPPVAARVEPEPATTPMVLVDSMAGFGQRIGTARSA